MYIDRQNLLSNSQALTETAASTDVIDLGVDRNVGQGEPLVVVVQVEVAADDGNDDETYVAAIQTDDNESFSSATTLGELTITRGDAAGTRYIFGLPATEQLERYVRVNYTLGGTSPSVTVSAFLAPHNLVDAYYSYPSGYTVS